MSNCKNCGEPLRPGAMFCAKCGASVTDEEPKNSNINIPTETKIETNVDDNNKKKKGGFLFTILKIVIGIIVFLFLVGLFFGKSDNKETKKEAVSTPVKKEQAVTLNSAKSALDSFGIKGEIISSTYNKNSDGFLANVDNKVYAVDLKNNQIATIENYSVMVRHVNKIRGRDNSSGNLIPQFLIYNDKHGKDDQMGEWRGNNHFLPIYILVECDAAGNIKSRGKMSSGLGAAPSHYQGYLEEQKNIDIANIFLKDIITFIEIPQNEAVNQGSHTNSSKSSPIYIGVINGDEVNVRQGPGTNYNSLGIFYKGDMVRLVGEQSDNNGKDWYNIEYDNPTAGLIKGWVRKDFINYNNPSEAAVSSPPIKIKQIYETSHLIMKEIDRAYPVSQIADGVINTCWGEGVPGHGVSEKVTFELDSVYEVKGFNIWTGYQKTEELFYKNGRPIALLVRSEDGYSNLHKFNDSMGMQRITFTRPIKAKYISFTIMEVAPGRKSDDTCISEISLF